MRNYLKKSLSFALIVSLTYGPLVSSKAVAGDTSEKFDRVCSKALKDVKGIKSTTGDQHMAYCVQADLAREAKNVETVKSVIYLAGAVVCTTMAIVEATGYGEAVAKPVCMATSIGGAAAGLIADISGKVIINNSKDSYGQAKDQVCSVATFMPLVMQLTPLVISAAGKGGTASENSGCIMCAVMMGLTGAISVASSISSKNAQNKFVDDASSVSGATKDSVVNLTNPATISLQHTGPTLSHTSGSGNPDAAPATDPCAGQSGNQYLTCVGNKSPEISALTNSSAFMGQMSKSLHGKNLGDFVKGYKGESKEDLANYVAAGLGVNPALVKGVMSNNDKMAKDTGFDKYTPMTYAHGGTKAKVGGDDLDFSKMMAGMMGKMDPEAGKDGKADPSELVFRQLELLPADKIEGDKNISLFARIAFRYRKNTSNVDQLNWSASSNQTGPAPAQKK